jgi:hypothetical protein
VRAVCGNPESIRTGQQSGQRQTANEFFHVISRK